ncbi:uncharacterized protein BDV17DRAFT_283786 [Aspergillus undulatus]|uniref:uncharacterized protein n=1 Tax=Aspergillus undulatus TaxID=1810928 RepID=UPI003CCD0C38
MSDTFSSIPVIDWRRLQNPATNSDALNDLREAIFVVGFLYLTNHGLEDLIRKAHAKLPELFNLPADVKAKCDVINSPSFVGYTQLGAETTAAKTDLREQYDFGTPGMKQWSEDQDIWWRLEGNSQECLSLPPDTFAAFKGNMDRLKFIKYLPSPPGSQGVGPHKDSSGLFTFLSQDDAGGLQVLNKNGEWIDAPPIEGSLVVNIQQGLEAITGGHSFFLGVRMDLTTEQLRESATHIVSRIPASDDRKKRAVDVPSEFLSPLYSCFGEAYLRNRILSHPDVGQRWYPELYEKYSKQVLS